MRTIVQVGDFQAPFPLSEEDAAHFQDAVRDIPDSFVQRWQEQGVQETLKTLAELRGGDGEGTRLVARFDLSRAFLATPIELLLVSNEGELVATIGRIGLTLPEGGRNELADKICSTASALADELRATSYAIRAISRVV